MSIKPRKHPDKSHLLSKLFLSALSFSIFTVVLPTIHVPPTLAHPSHTSPATAPPKIPAHYYKEISVEGFSNPFTMEIYLTRAKGKVFLEYIGSSPATSHTTSFKTPLKPSSSGHFDFAFVDEWKTSGKGTVKFSGKQATIHTEKTKDSPGGLNATECWPDKETLTLER